MAAVDVQAPPAEAAPAIPDYLASPNAVLGDKDVKWRYGRAPDYSKTRKVWEESEFLVFCHPFSIGSALHVHLQHVRCTVHWPGSL